MLLGMILLNLAGFIFLDPLDQPTVKRQTPNAIHTIFEPQFQTVRLGVPELGDRHVLYKQMGDIPTAITLPAGTHFELAGRIIGADPLNHLDSRSASRFEEKVESTIPEPGDLHIRGINTPGRSPFPGPPIEKRLKTRNPHILEHLGRRRRFIYRDQ